MTAMTLCAAVLMALFALALLVALARWASPGRYDVRRDDE